MPLISPVLLAWAAPALVGAGLAALAAAWLAARAAATLKDEAAPVVAGRPYDLWAALRISALLATVLVAAALAAPLLLITRQQWPTSRQWRSIAIVMVGVVAGFPLLSAWAMQSAPASHGAVVLGLIPLATAFMGSWRAHEKPSPAFWLASASGSLEPARLQRLTMGRDLELRSVAFTACLVAVGASWAGCWALLALGFATLQAPVAVCAALAVAIFGTVLACRLGARVLARSSMIWWPLVTVLLGGSSIGIAYCLLWSLGLVNHRLSGPTSPSGMATTIVVRDAWPSLSADFYTDVRVVDTSGNIVAEWKDPWGWGSRNGPRLMRDSMSWTSANTLAFRTGYGQFEHLTVR